MPRTKKVIENPATETAAAAEETKKPARRTKKVKPEEVVKEVAAVVDTAGKSVKEAVKKVEAQVEKTMEKQAGKQVEKKAVVRSKKKESAPAITIQSKMGGEIALDEIIKLVNEKAAGKTVTNIYIKSEDNKAYYVADGEDGYVQLWD